MAQIRPFPSSRPSPERARDVASVPYDVVDTKEALELAAGNPASFLHVCRPEIDLPEGISLYSDPVYAKGRENLDRFEADGTLVPDPVPRLLVYRQTWRGAAQDGLVAACAVDDYDSDVIKKHEKTRKDKEDDRTKHLLVQAAHAEPVFLTYRATDAIDARVAKVTAAPPGIDFEAVDGVRHTLWAVPEEDQTFFVEAFASIPVLYVADGHHRSASASRARAAMKEKGPVGPEHPVQWFPAAIFPDRELRILPYNRLVKDLLGRTPDEFLVGRWQGLSREGGDGSEGSRAGRQGRGSGCSWADAGTPSSPGNPFRRPTRSAPSTCPFSRNGSSRRSWASRTPAPTSGSTSSAASGAPTSWRSGSARGRTQWRSRCTRRPSRS